MISDVTKRVGQKKNVSICCKYIVELRQFQCVPTTYVNDNNENYKKMYSYQVSCPLSLLF